MSENHLRPGKAKSKVKDIVWFFKNEGIRPRILALILVVDLGLIWAAFFAGEEGLSAPSWETLKPWITIAAGFSARQWVSLITPAAALIMAWFAHWCDGKKTGRGIKDITGRRRGTAYNLETDVIAASMTKQSVLAAIASILIVIIQAAPKTSDYLRLVWILSTLGFVLAILLLLVSMVCYDYASRFNWSSFYKAELVRKALRFDIWSWYYLLTSLILSIALISTRLSILSGIFSGVLMWWYYFFRPEKAGTDLYIRGLSGIVISVRDLDAAKVFYGNKLGLKILNESELQVGDWGKIKLVQSSTPGITSPELVFTVSADDFEAAKETLHRNQVSHTSETGTPESVTFHDADGLNVRIRSLS